jgi:hypothetical protein
MSMARRLPRYSSDLGGCSLGEQRTSQESIHLSRRASEDGSSTAPTTPDHHDDSECCQRCLDCTVALGSDDIVCNSVPKATPCLDSSSAACAAA